MTIIKLAPEEKDQKRMITKCISFFVQFNVNLAYCSVSSVSLFYPQYGIAIIMQTLLHATAQSDK